MSKIVFSSTLTEPLSWANTRLIARHPVEAVREMKDHGTEAMRTLGSLTLCRSLLAVGIADRFRVVVFPVITGSTGRDRTGMSVKRLDEGVAEEGGGPNKPQKRRRVSARPAPDRSSAAELAADGNEEDRESLDDGDSRLQSRRSPFRMQRGADRAAASERRNHRSEARTPLRSPRREHEAERVRRLGWRGDGQYELVAGTDDIEVEKRAAGLLGSGQRSKPRLELVGGKEAVADAVARVLAAGRLAKK
jgi:hypothetical protein